MEVDQGVAVGEDLVEEERRHDLGDGAIAAAGVGAAGVFAVEQDDMGGVAPEGGAVDDGDQEEVAGDLGGVNGVGDAEDSGDAGVLGAVHATGDADGGAVAVAADGDVGPGEHGEGLMMEAKGAEGLGARCSDSLQSHAWLPDGFVYRCPVEAACGGADRRPPEPLLHGHAIQDDKLVATRLPVDALVDPVEVDLLVEIDDRRIVMRDLLGALYESCIRFAGSAVALSS